MKWITGEVYDGEWKDDQMDGNAVFSNNMG